MISGRHSSDHMPVELVKKARIIFDRLSPRGAPISYHEFAIRWPEYQRENFPVTFLDCLRRVTPPNGMLTFERFCAGLRLAVAEERENHHRQSTPVYGRQQVAHSGSTQNGQGPPAPPTRGPESVEKTKQLMTVYGSSQSMMAGQPSVRPTPPPYNVALSRSRMNLESIDQNSEFNKMNVVMTRSTPQLCEKKPSNGVALARRNQCAIRKQSNDVRVPITQNNVQKNGHRNCNSRPSSAQSTDTNGSLEGIKFRDKSAHVNGGQRGQQQDSRRHTMMEGTESSSSHSKHTLLMQEEKGLLKKALDTASRLQTWYNHRLSSLETREKLMGKSMIPVDFAVHEEKLNYLRAHTTELNRRAVALMESSEKGFPSHMNLELHRNIPQPADDHLMWLKRQNKMLTDEVAEKCERITQLEREKAQLLKNLCESPGNAMQHSTSIPFSNGSSSGVDSGFHSLSHQSPTPGFPPNQHQTAVPNGHHQRPQSASNAVYATPFVGRKEARYERMTAQSSPYALLHNAPTECPMDGVLATFM